MALNNGQRRLAEVYWPRILTAWEWTPYAMQGHMGAEPGDKVTPKGWGEQFPGHEEGRKFLN